MGGCKLKWTLAEEAALHRGVAKYGKGKWRAIQKDEELGPILGNRSNIDLKDKWRNLNIKTPMKRSAELSDSKEYCTEYIELAEYCNYHSQEEVARRHAVIDHVLRAVGYTEEEAWDEAETAATVAACASEQEQEAAAAAANSACDAGSRGSSKRRRGTGAAARAGAAALEADSGSNAGGASSIEELADFIESHRLSPHGAPVPAAEAKAEEEAKPVRVKRQRGAPGGAHAGETKPLLSQGPAPEDMVVAAIASLHDARGSTAEDIYGWIQAHYSVDPTFLSTLAATLLGLAQQGRLYAPLPGIAAYKLAGIQQLQAGECEAEGEEAVTLPLGAALGSCLGQNNDEAPDEDAAAALAAAQLAAHVMRSVSACRPAGHSEPWHAQHLNNHNAIYGGYE